MKETGALVAPIRLRDLVHSTSGPRGKEINKKTLQLELSPVIVNLSVANWPYATYGHLVFFHHIGT